MTSQQPTPHGPTPHQSTPHRSTLGRILVTGGASGLGAAVARAVREEGGSPVVLDRAPLESTMASSTVSTESTDSSDSSVSPSIDAKVVDLADREAAEAAVRDIVEEYGDLDGVVTCAGVDSCGPLDEVPAAEWDRVIAVNLVGTAAVVRAALPSLRRTHGRLVTVASTLGLRALPAASAYCASKFGVVGLTRALAVELAGDVGVTLLVPGGMDTSFFDGRDPQYQPPADAKLNRPEDVAQAVCFALAQPAGCEVRELVITPSVEPSWP